MLKKGEIEIEGVVAENLPNTTFWVETADGQRILCTISGRMRMNHIRVLPGDKVKFTLTPYDAGKGRITYKLR
jgi:translation initiation factor IF-1